MVNQKVLCRYFEHSYLKTQREVEISGGSFEVDQTAKRDLTQSASPSRVISWEAEVKSSIMPE